MRRPARGAIRSIVQAWLFVLLAGCAGTMILPEDALTPLSGSAAALVERGPFDARMVAGTHRGEYGCLVSYETHRPAGGDQATMVFLAHGYSRNLSTMRGWAEHWASHGIAVTVVELCNSSIFAGRHERNAADMIALAGELHEGPRIYAGFSAGGLAAFLAARGDTRTAGYLGLDSVDHQRLALTAGAGADFPALMLMAEPSRCNRDSSMVGAWAERPGLRALRIRNSTHCHFEYPYAPTCELACGAVRPRQLQRVLIDSVRSLATAWILALASGESRPARGAFPPPLARGAWEERIDFVR